MKIPLFLCSVFLSLSTASWTICQKQSICFHNEIVHLKGINWFGLETTDFTLGGLQHNTLDFYLKLLETHRFNALRIPFSEECIYFRPCISSITNRSVLESLDDLFDKTFDFQIAIILDLHRLRPEYASPSWFLSKYTYETFSKTWHLLMKRYGNRTNLLGINLFNEPHDIAMNTSFYVNTMLSLKNDLVTAFPNLQTLFFLDGLHWGKDFRDFPISNDFVYSIHNYGPSILPNLPYDRNVWTKDWMDQFGFLFQYDVATVVTEWGGRYQSPKDIDWMNEFASYLMEHSRTDNFYWALNPDSKDVGGLLQENWNFLDTHKLQLLNTMNPNASVFAFTDRFIIIQKPKSKPRLFSYYYIYLILFVTIVLLLLIAFRSRRN